MIIETERLILREIDPARDFEGWAKTMADENIVRLRSQQGLPGVTEDRVLIYGQDRP